MSALPAPRPIQPANDTALSPALGDERNEQKILGAVMMEGMKDPSNTAFKKIAHFKEHYFGWHIHRIVFRAMTLVYDEGMNVEYDSVHDRLKKMENKNISGQFAIEKVGEQFLGSLLTLKGSNITLLSELVLKAWVRRNETTAADNSKTWAADGNLTLSQFLEKTSSQATENMLVYSSLLGSRSQSMTEGMATVAADIAKDRSTPGAVGWIWHTGFQGLSDLMGGGFEAGAVYVFGGRPGEGKSTILQCAATAILNQTGRPFILSIEMSPDKYWQRILVAEAGIELSRIKSGNMTQDERDHLSECLLRLQNHKMGDQFRIEYMRMPTLAQMRTKIAQEKHAHGMDALFIDYASFRKVTPTNDKLPPNIQQGLISQWCSNIANEFRIPVITAAQMSRDIDRRGGDPLMSDLEQSIAMEQDTDFIGLLKDDDVRAGSGYTVTNCHVVKSRNGATGIVPLIAKKHLFKFEDMRD